MLSINKSNLQGLTDKNSAQIYFLLTNYLPIFLNSISIQLSSNSIKFCANFLCIQNMFSNKRGQLQVADGNFKYRGLLQLEVALSKNKMDCGTSFAHMAGEFQSQEVFYS